MAKANNFNREEKKYLRERTLVLIKPEGVSRKLVGRIIQRFEDLDYKIIGLGLVQASEKIFDQHYPKDQNWVERLATKTLESAAASGIEVDLKRDYGVKTKIELGRLIRTWLIKFMASGPIVKICLEGPFAVEKIRKITGATIPIKAEAGTIRGDFSFDSAIMANLQKRPVLNLIHAAETKEDALKEIKLWFKDSELSD